MIHKAYKYLILSLFLSFSFAVQSQDTIHVVAKKGDGIHSLLARYNLDSTKYVKLFIKLNEKKLGTNKWLYAGESYIIPAGKNSDNDKTSVENTGEPENSDGIFEIFGDDYSKVSIVDNSLSGAVFYIVSGHGGPDPGAQGNRDGNSLCEDEYAYDISIRLCRELIKYGAKAYLIIRDSTDGIRDEAYLKCDKDEYCWPKEKLPLNHLRRLKQRCNIINKLYDENTASYQRVIMIHVDSRATSQRVDVFFYHHSISTNGKSLADNLQNTFKEKYDQFQPDRGYHGTVTARDGLYMISNTKPPAVYIELGNIQNSLDQIRFIKKENRQALAKWLAQGVIKDYKEKK